MLISIEDTKRISDDSSYRFTMIPASVYLGFAASVIWVGEVQAAYLKFASTFVSF